jgi:hypothetical protein
MRTAPVLAAALVALASLTLIAQEVKSAARPEMAVNAADSGYGSAAAVLADHPNPPIVRVRRPMFIRAELMGKLDSKSAKAGDPVVLRVQETVKAADGTQIPKGTRIVGRVTAVVAHSKGGANALVTVEFDHTEAKGVENLPIRAAIQWAEPMPSPSTAEALRSQENMGGGVMGGAANVTGGSQSGGLGTGNSGGMVVTGGMVQLTAKQTEGLGSVADYGLQAPAEAKNEAAGAHTVLTVGGKATASVRATGVPGVMLAVDPSGQASGTFMAVKQNVHLEGATRMVLAVATMR